MVSIIAKIRAGHRAAREQPSKKGDVGSSQPSTPYRHVPSHALTDALAGTPGSYRKSDRARIREQHRRRSAMTSAAPSEATASSSTSQASSSYVIPPVPSLGDKVPVGLRTKPKIERRDSGPGRSRLSSMEVSPHISGANSRASVQSSSSEHSSEESLSKITEEAQSPVPPPPPPLDHSYIIDPMVVSDDESHPITPPDDTPQSFWSAPRQLSSSTEKAPAVDTVQPIIAKPTRRWGFGRRSAVAVA